VDDVVLVEIGGGFDDISDEGDGLGFRDGALLIDITFNAARLVDFYPSLQYSIMR
jgi:hypothetical protein